MSNSKKSYSVIFIVVFLLLCILGSIFSSPSEKNNLENKVNVATTEKGEIEGINTQSRVSVHVTDVVDGDTIKVRFEDGTIATVRLIGIDTPETVDPRKEVECYGREASDFAKQMLESKEILLESDSTQGESDKYDRLLRYVYLIDGTFFNLTAVKQGYAHEYTYSIPYKYQAEFKKAEENVKTNNLGLFGDICNKPVDSLTTGSFTPNQEVVENSLNESIPTPPLPEPVLDPISEPILTPPLTQAPSFVCDCSKACPQLTCDEAYFQLNQCGCKKRDGDNDGVPCEDHCN